VTLHYLARSDSEPIDTTANPLFDHFDESSGFRRQGSVAYQGINVVEMVQDDPSWLVR
jgi:hypothetical protein